MTAAGGRELGGCSEGAEVRANPAFDAHGLGADETHLGWRVDEIKLPANPNECEAVSHEEAIARSFAFFRVVEHPQHAFVAAIDNLKKDGAVAVFGLSRTQDVDIGGELDKPVAVGGRGPEPVDVLVGGVVGVDGEVGRADESLVAVRGFGALGDVDVDDGGSEALRKKDDCEQ